MAVLCSMTVIPGVFRRRAPVGMRDLQRTIARRRSFDAHLDHSDRRLPSACVGRRRCQSAAPGICRPRRWAVQVLAAVGVVVGSTTAAGVACRARDDRHRTMRFTSSCLRGYATKWPNGVWFSVFRGVHQKVRSYWTCALLAWRGCDGAFALKVDGACVRYLGAQLVA